MLELAPQLASAFILGLLGGGHCLGMCGGLMGALTLAIPPSQRGRRLSLLLAYNVGRVLGYAAAGLLVGLLGWAVASSPGATGMRVAAALLLIVMGFYLAGWWSGLTRIEGLGRGLWRCIEPVAGRLLPISTLPRALLLGSLWGWLPCGLVYSSLLWAASQGNALHSALLMLGFGLGTCPVLLATGLAAERTRTLLRRRGLRTAGGVLVILFGLWTLPGPHQHWLMGHQAVVGAIPAARSPWEKAPVETSFPSGIVGRAGTRSGVLI
jgi:sulfite exporter TauE/SafE